MPVNSQCRLWGALRADDHRLVHAPFLINLSFAADTMHRRIINRMDDTQSSKLFVVIVDDDRKLRCKKDKYQVLHSGSMEQIHNQNGEALRTAVEVER